MHHPWDEDPVVAALLRTRHKVHQMQTSSILGLHDMPSITHEWCFAIHRCQAAWACPAWVDCVICQCLGPETTT